MCGFDMDGRCAIAPLDELPGQIAPQWSCGYNTQLGNWHPQKRRRAKGNVRASKWTARLEAPMLRKRFGYALTLAGTLAFAIPAFAQKPANAPANATAQCTDGTYSTAKSQKGACARHGGVKTWWGGGDEKTTSAKGTEKAAAPSSGGAAKESGTGSVPKGATGQCTDGSYTRAKTEASACSKHGGVKTWFAASSSATPPATPSPATPATAATTPAAGSKPASTPAPKTPATSSAKAATTTRPADAPAGATAKCKDGTYSMSKTHSGACSHHGGVAEWYK